MKPITRFLITRSLATEKLTADFTKQTRIYPRRHNIGGTIDSICPDCLQTVATSEAESELYAAENNHYCDPERILQLWGNQKWFGQDGH
jgi:hypothetical protein